MTWRIWVVAAAVQVAATAGVCAQNAFAPPATDIVQTPTATGAPSTKDIAVQARAQERGCQQACRLDYRSCNLNEGGRKRGHCDTSFVRCAIACQDCASAQMRCGLEARLAGAPGCAQEPAVCRSQEARAPAHSLITFEGGDGGSTDTPVTIKGARDIREGLLAQMLWIGKTYWGWRRHDRQLARDKDRVLDRVEFTTPQGDKRTVFFDISEFHDKH